MDDDAVFDKFIAVFLNRPFVEREQDVAALVLGIDRPVADPDAGEVMSAPNPGHYVLRGEHVIAVAGKHPTQGVGDDLDSLAGSPRRYGK